MVEHIWLLDKIIGNFSLQFSLYYHQWWLTGPWYQVGEIVSDDFINIIVFINI